MKRKHPFLLGCLWAVAALLLSPPSHGEDPGPGSGGKAGAKTDSPSPIRQKAKEEMRALQKDTQRAGQEIQRSTRGLPAEAGKEFKKTGRALKNAGKEMKDSAQESLQDLKKVFQK